MGKRNTTKTAKFCNPYEEENKEGKIKGNIGGEDIRIARPK